MSEGNPIILDCGDNSCRFAKQIAKQRGGLRTNGGCRCAENNPRELGRYANYEQHINVKLQASLKEARELIDNAVRATDTEDFYILEWRDWNEKAKQWLEKCK